MDASEAMDLGREALTLVLVLGAPVLLTGLAVGLLVGLLQAVTQVHEQALSFVPRILAMLLALAVFGPWMLTRLIEFGTQMFTLP